MVGLLVLFHVTNNVNQRKKTTDNQTQRRESRNPCRRLKSIANSALVDCKSYLVETGNLYVFRLTAFCVTTSLCLLIIKKPYKWGHGKY